VEYFLIFTEKGSFSKKKSKKSLKMFGGSGFGALNDIVEADSAVLMRRRKRIQRSQ
jgi:hypothetical protein